MHPSLATYRIFFSLARTQSKSRLSKKKKQGARSSSLYSLQLCSYHMTNEPCEMTFPFRLHTCREKAKHPTDGWMAEPSKLLYPPLIWWKWKEPGQWLFTKTTWDGAAEFQAPRMINGFANPVGLQTQMRTELIAVRNALAWMERKRRRAAAKKEPSCRSELLVGFCLQEFTRCP